jgi:hypothetical protein
MQQKRVARLLHGQLARTSSYFVFNAALTAFREGPHADQALKAEYE